MTTWIEDLKKTNPELAKDYALVGNQNAVFLRNMVRALEMFGGFFNSEEDNARLAAAKRILRHKARQKQH